MVAEATTAASGIITSSWVVVLLPVISALLTLFFGKRTPGKGAVYGIVAMGAAFVMSLLILWHFVQGGGTYASGVNWFTIGPFHVEVGQYIDGLAAVMLVVVTTVSLCVHVYSLGYMDGDVRFTWFYVVLSLFTAAMLNVVIAPNLIQLLIGWEIMGVCSYLLIGHWYEEKQNSDAAIKAFITTRIGDVPMMFGIFALIFATGFTTSNISAIGELVKSHELSSALVAGAAILLFGGTIGKSAQFPLHVWLPDAMAGPTPVSALIHAATMVAAGVYLVGRMYEVFINADAWVLQVVGIIGAITMLGLRVHGADPGRHQAGAGLLHAVPAGVHGRLHVARTRRSQRRLLPPVHARVLQGAALPGGGIGDPRGSLQQHERHGRLAETHARHVLDVPDRIRRARGHRAARRLLVEGRDARRPLPKGTSCCSRSCSSRPC